MYQSPTQIKFKCFKLIRFHIFSLKPVTMYTKQWHYSVNSTPTLTPFPSSGRIWSVAPREHDRQQGIQRVCPQSWLVSWRLRHFRECQELYYKVRQEIFFNLFFEIQRFHGGYIVIFLKYYTSYLIFFRLSRGGYDGQKAKLPKNLPKGHGLFGLFGLFILIF